MTQTERVEQYMRDFGSITQLEAMKDLGVMRLSARIWDLKNRNGVRIKAKQEKAFNRYGDAVFFVRYSIEKEDE